MRAVLLALICAACSRSDKPTPASQPATSSTQDALREKCCGQCRGAASRDPAGMDLTGKTCTSYPAEWNGGQGVDDECRGYFAAQPQPLTVGDCRAP